MLRGHSHAKLTEMAGVVFKTASSPSLVFTRPKEIVVMHSDFVEPADALEIVPRLTYSSSYEMRLPLRWVAILHGRIQASIAATSGIHRASDVAKMLLVGADVTQLCSALMRHGIKQISVIEHDLRVWLEQHEYESVRQARGCLSLGKVPDAGAYERGNYMKILAGWKP